MILKVILKSFDFQCNFDFYFQITTSKMIWIFILNRHNLGDLILILKSSTYDDFAHLCRLHISHKNVELSSVLISECKTAISRPEINVILIVNFVEKYDGLYE